MLKLKVFWDTIRTLGLGDDSKKNIDIALMNQIAFTAGVACILMAISGFLEGIHWGYSFCALFLGGIVLIILALNARQCFHLSRFIVACVIPLVIAGFIILIGGDFGEEGMLSVVLFLVYVFYKNESRTQHIFYALIAVSYTLSKGYLYFYTPLFAQANNPYDNIFVFICCLLWLVMIIKLLHRKISSQKEHQKKLITEMKVKNSSLQKTTEELEQFTYIASHDLKSPLRTIISFLDLIKRDVQRERYDDLMDKLDFARSGAEQMNFLVTDILEYSKIARGKKRNRRVVNLHSVVEKVKFNLNEIIKEKNVDLYIFPLPDFYCNETEMTILFQNFIENGIKYNEEATPTVFVKASIIEKQLVLQFIDNGIGIEEQYFEKIFLFFKRLHTSEAYKGTGLGLGLCKKIIEDMEGSIKVESTINVGTSFTVHLPLIEVETQKNSLEVECAET